MKGNFLYKEKKNINKSPRKIKLDLRKIKRSFTSAKSSFRKIKRSFADVKLRFIFTIVCFNNKRLNIRLMNKNSNIQSFCITERSSATVYVEPPMKTIAFVFRASDFAAE